MEPSDIVELIYKFYGTDSGYLFGLEPSQRPVVGAIVKATLAILEEIKEGTDGGDIE